MKSYRNEAIALDAVSAETPLMTSAAAPAAWFNKALGS
jgi:hypothetical protein